ncbi:HAMP domain-containing histidine kinase [Chitinophagaceae bacterium LB-8]|uniref:histidine kinase n=1 Tax=Paraflavisolibacter caeni TaxID=2982496 RepID=A0A9X2Y125_9BACT|nr:HAMP domain-containing sensor histidine kinase [Paraflavisolibacter caeni]MCU7552497.1 HAMP domain-containing histidine kinase [Paraflavisolibacter caeni]
MNILYLYRNSASKQSLIIAATVLLLLSLVSSFYFRINPSTSYEEKKLEQYIHKQQNDFNSLLKDTSLLRKLVQQTESLEELQKLTKKNYGIFLYVETLSGPSLFFWNNQSVIPSEKALQLPDGEHFQRLSNGYYLILKENLRFPGMSNNIQAFALIPILYQFEHRSEYLLTHFAHDKDAINKVDYSEARTPFVIHSLKGKPLFYIKGKTYMPIAAIDSITLTLRIFALILLLLFLHLEAETIVRKKGPVKGVLFLVTALISIRAFLFLFPSIFYFRQFQLFDPQIYSANWLNPSLGDLLFNAIVFCWIVLFTWYKKGPGRQVPAFFKEPWSYIVGGLCLWVLILSTFLLADIVRSLVADSSISFNVTFFFTLTIYTAVGFIVLALLSLSYYYFTRLLFQLILPAFAKRQILIYFIIVAVGLFNLTFHSGNSIVLFHIPVLLWLVIYTFLLSQEQSIINRFRATTAGMLFWIFVFSVSLSVVILSENQKKELKTQKNFAEKQNELTDPSQERTLSIALNYLDKEFFAKNYYRFLNPTSNRFLRDSIIKENMFAGYRRAYNTELFVFDSLYHGLNNTDPSTFSELNSIFTIRSKPTGIPDLYYHEPSFDKITYITRRIVEDSTGIKGTVFIVSSPVKYGSENLTPELFRQVNKRDIESEYYPFAVYNNKGILISASSKYPFPTVLTYKEIPKKEYETRVNGDYDELWYKATNNKVVVTAKKRDTFLESITLFSYFFCAFLIMVASLQLVVLLLRATYGWNLLNAFSELSIRSQVHGTVIFISVLSFLIIGVATISFFITRYNRNNIDKLSETSGIMVKEMQRRMSEQGSIDDISNIYDSASKANLKKLVEEVANIHNREVNVYDVQGNLQVYSNAEVYQRGVLSTKIHPIAYYHLNRLRQVHYVQKESMSSLEYLSIYTPVRNDSGHAYAYLNIPYFTTGQELQQEISNFLVTIINLNAFIFLIAGVIALFITNRITRSFSVIGNKMREITLGKANEEIVWTKKDEIGELVKHYNKMVHKLEESAAALAKSEREGAWREMARQVAHEIKNPLTPMKLSIQYLQKAINNNQPNINELTTRVANTLVEQIDHLSKIAADFSRFANIGNRNIEQFDLHHVLESLMDLYKTNPKVKITWNKLEGEVQLNADRTHINRLFTNLLTNAVESCAQKDHCKIIISEVSRDNAILVSVIDNGEGIPFEMHQRIFTPNFTTKSSGTGLGLAMCKGIVEQAGGEIWFETEEGKGTTFFVQLPAKLKIETSIVNNHGSYVDEPDNI